MPLVAVDGTDLTNLDTKVKQFTIVKAGTSVVHDVYATQQQLNYNNGNLVSGKAIYFYNLQGVVTVTCEAYYTGSPVQALYLQGGDMASVSNYNRYGTPTSQNLTTSYAPYSFNIRLAPGFFNRIYVCSYVGSGCTVYVRNVQVKYDFETTDVAVGSLITAS